MEPRTRPDPHSYFEAEGPVIQHLDWKVGVNFETRRLECTATLHFDRGGWVSLDTRDLTVLSVDYYEGLKLKWRLDDSESILGSRLRIEVLDGVNVAAFGTPQARKRPASCG